MADRGNRATDNSADAERSSTVQAAIEFVLRFRLEVEIASMARLVEKGGFGVIFFP